MWERRVNYWGTSENLLGEVAVVWEPEEEVHLVLNKLHHEVNVFARYLAHIRCVSKIKMW